MKTLDEVIRACEICMSDDSKAENCIGCPYADDKGEPLCCGEDKEDALHYLKAYKDDKDDLTALRAYWAEQQANEPLTWVELAQMVANGKPVWIEMNHFGVHWYFIDMVTEDIAIFIGMYKESVQLYRDEYGKTWQAYRKERI